MSCSDGAPAWTIRGVLALAACVLTSTPQAQPLLPDELRGSDWDLRELEALTARSRALLAPGAVHPDALGIAEQIAERLRAGTPAASAAVPGSGVLLSGRPVAPSTDPAGRALLLFVSSSMGEAGVRDALAAASEDGAAIVVWRGLQSGEQLRDGVLRMARLGHGLQPVPEQQIDPPAFARHKVEAVPSIVDPLTGSELRGSTDLVRMRQRLAWTQESAPFEQAIGPTASVVEPDFAAELRVRATGLDVSREMQRSASLWWSRQSFVELPVAPRDRVRQVDPTLWLQADLRLSGGTVLAAAGTRINPLEHVALRARLLVFDARDLRQVAWVREQIATGAPAILLATAFDRDGGWEAHAALVRRLGQRVQLLSAVLRDRLGLEFVPSLIEAEGSALRVTETAHARLPSAEEVRHVAPP